MPLCSLSPEIRSRIISLDGKWDVHIHTHYAPEDKSKTPDLTIAGVIERAESIGLEGIVFAEHVRKSSFWIKEYSEEIDHLAEKTKLFVIKGVESKIKSDLSLDLPKECLDGKWWITGSVHTFKGRKEDWIKAMYQMIGMPFVTTMGHMGTQYDGIQSDEIKFDLSDDELISLARAIVHNRKLVEINAHHKLPRLKWVEIFRREGVEFCLASDSHTLSTIGKFENVKDLLP